MKRSHQSKEEEYVGQRPKTMTPAKELDMVGDEVYREFSEEELNIWNKHIKHVDAQMTNKNEFMKAFLPFY